MSISNIELGINIDHVATVRQARRAPYPVQHPLGSAIIQRYLDTRRPLSDGRISEGWPST